MKTFYQAVQAPNLFSPRFDTHEEAEKWGKDQMSKKPNLDELYIVTTVSLMRRIGAPVEVINIAATPAANTNGSSDLVKELNKQLPNGGYAHQDGCVA